MPRPPSPTILPHLFIRNFKRFDAVEIELGNPVVFIGPNNSGKTSAMQALALWDIGLRRWNEKRATQPIPGKRSGVAVNRRDLVAIPVPHANLLWRDRRVRSVVRADGRQSTSNIRVDVAVSGIANGAPWKCGLEFDYANEESFYCRPLRLSGERNPPRMPVPDAAGQVAIAFLPPMSGLAANEARLDPGAVNVRVGEGRTAEVLRNLCWTVYERGDGWDNLAGRIRDLFGAELQPPRYIAARGEIAMSYRERGIDFDLSSSGRGLQQTLLLLAYMHTNPGAVLLLDEPDAHLEILRQRQTYRLLTDMAEATGSQIIAASHSEVVLNEAAGRDLVIAFVGTPHRIDNRGSQVLKSLTEVGFEHYHQAEQTGWVLYLEGSTDLAMLRAFAKRLDHQPALRALDRPFVHYMGNQPMAAIRHFQALREALPELRAVGILDRLDREPPKSEGIDWLVWKRREFENYLTTRRTLERFAAAGGREASAGPLFGDAEARVRVEAMHKSIVAVEAAMRTLGKGSPWSKNIKAGDDFLAPLFADYFGKLGLPNAMRKKSFHVLARHVPRDEIDGEVGVVLGAVGGAFPATSSSGSA